MQNAHRRGKWLMFKEVRIEISPVAGLQCRRHCGDAASGFQCRRHCGDTAQLPNNKFHTERCTAFARQMSIKNVECRSWVNVHVEAFRVPVKTASSTRPHAKVRIISFQLNYHSAVCIITSGAQIWNTMNNNQNPEYSSSNSIKFFLPHSLLVLAHHHLHTSHTLNM